MATTAFNKTARAVGTTPVQIGTYAAPAATNTFLLGLSLADITAGDITVAAYLKDVSNNETYIIPPGAVVIPGMTLTLGADTKIALNEGDRIYVVSDTAASVDVIMSLMEQA